MPERFWQWELLDLPSDPVVADTAAFDARISHFRGLAEAIRVEGQRLGAIASGAALTGKYADALRSASGDVAKDFDQVVGRYDAVVSALVVYRPAVDEALRGSEQALNDAIDASGAQRNADALAEAKATGDTALTTQQEQANADKVMATTAAVERLNAAKSKLAGVLDRLDEAGQRAATAIRAGFNDGLKDTGWQRFKHAFKAFLKILVKVLTYIGMALAVIALFIPGIGQLVMAAGLVIGAAVLAADIALKAMGEGSWVDIGLGIAGLVTFGASRFVAPARAAFRPAMSATKTWGTITWASTKSMGSSGWKSVKDMAGQWKGAGSRPAPPARQPVNHLGIEIPSSRFTTFGRTDAEVLEEYTASAYTRMNTFTRGGPIASAESGISTAADVAAIERALDARPPHIGTTMRGTSLRQDVFDSFQPGKTITSDALWSTSTRENVSENFGIGRGIDSMLTINGKTGRSITDVSLTAAEQEVLFKPWTKFRIDSGPVFDPAIGRQRFELTEV